MINIARKDTCIIRKRGCIEIKASGSNWQDAVRMQIPDAVKITKHGFTVKTIILGSRLEKLRKQRFHIVHADGSSSYPAITADWMIEGGHDSVPAAAGALLLDAYLKEQVTGRQEREEKLLELEFVLQARLPEADFDGIFDIVRSPRRIKRLGKIREQLMRYARALAKAAGAAAVRVIGGFKLYEVHLTGQRFGVRLPLLMPALL